MTRGSAQPAMQRLVASARGRKQEGGLEVEGGILRSGRSVEGGEVEEDEVETQGVEMEVEVQLGVRGRGGKLQAEGEGEGGREEGNPRRFSGNRRTSAEIQMIRLSFDVQDNAAEFINAEFGTSYTLSTPWAEFFAEEPTPPACGNGATGEGQHPEGSLLAMDLPTDEEVGTSKRNWDCLG